MKGRRTTEVDFPFSLPGIMIHGNLAGCLTSDRSKRHWTRAQLCLLVAMMATAARAPMKNMDMLISLNQMWIGNQKDAGSVEAGLYHYSDVGMENVMNILRYMKQYECFDHLQFMVRLRSAKPRLDNHMSEGSFKSRSKYPVPHRHAIKGKSQDRGWTLVSYKSAPYSYYEYPWVLDLDQLIFMVGSGRPLMKNDGKRWYISAVGSEAVKSWPLFESYKEITESSIKIFTRICRYLIAQEFLSLDF